MVLKREFRQVTRFEVIGKEGRLLTKHNVEIELSLQDNGKTLKVFLKENN